MITPFALQCALVCIFYVAANGFTFPARQSLARKGAAGFQRLVLQGSLQDDLYQCFKGGYVSPELVDSSSIRVRSNVTFSNDVFAFRGSPEYSAQAREAIKYVAPTLQSCEYSVERVSAVSSLSYSVLWNVTFIPESIQLLALLSNLPGLRSEYFNLLDREGFSSSFSWSQLWRFVGRCATTGVVKLPHAVIKGQTELKFEESNSVFELVEQREKISLVESIRAKRLKNRVLVGHLLEFLSARRPSSITFEEWEDSIFQRVPYRSVPGMGQFDIDGISGEQTQSIVAASSRVLSYATTAVLAFGLILAANLLNKYINN